MSRIHEALKRAEQERAASQTAQDVEERAERVAIGAPVEAPAPFPVNSALSYSGSDHLPKSSSRSLFQGSSVR